MPKINNVAIIGSNSFSGSHTVNHFLSKTKANVFGISRSPENKSIYLPYKSNMLERFTFHQMDLNRDLDRIIGLLDKERPDVIINFAAQGEVRSSWNYPVHWFRTNTLALVGLLDKLKDRKYIRRYIHASTPEVYGETNGPLREGMLYQPSTPYAASKAAGDLFIYTLKKSHGFPATLTRAANVYGPHQQLYRIIPRTIISIKKGIKLPLHGRGESKRAFIHIEDVCEALVQIAKNEKPSFIYHLSSERIRTIKSVVELICQEMGADFSSCVKYTGKPLAQDSSYDLDYSLAKKELGFKPKWKLEDGIKEVIRWVDENWEEIKNEPTEYIHKE